ncbi:MAG: ABC transporter permease [Hyphomicrobiales bacterium]|nr:MAG: ABC transporter permease [Hyphomicrobiales bacterium]
MISFIIKRLLQSMLVMLTVAFISFGLFRFVGDPVSNMAGQDTSIEDRQELRKSLGLDDPVYIQFFNFTINAAQGKFGQSYMLREPVRELMAKRFPATLELALVSSVIAMLLGVPMGVYTAIRRNTLLSKAFMTISLMGVSLPTFLIGILLILLFGVTLRWLPTFGRGDVVQLGWWSTGLLTASGLKAIIMPAITLGIFQMTLIMRLVRAEMMEILRTDYIKFGRARGLSNRSLYFRHALKNTLIPVITITGLQIGSIIAFALITESVFQWPGMGLLFIQAVGNADVPIMAAYLVLIAFIFVVINLIVDVLYVIVDPRLRASSEGD